MELFKLLGTIAIKNDEATDALDETGRRGEKTQSKLSTAFGAIGKGAVAVGKTIATGLAVGATAMAGLTVKALNLSGELEQNMGGSEAVFGEYADNVQAKAKEAFGKMGLATADYLATANKMGALFQGAGFDVEESLTLSSDAMQRAADVASIMGIDTSSAMEAIAGAAKGNFTMMDNLGVAMNDTTLNAYALEKGIGKTTQEMTNQEKIGLAMEMFMEKTAYATDNYAKENETLAGSLSTAKAALTNFLDGSGDVDSLVSSFENAANVIISNISELAPRLISGLTEIVNQITPLLPGLIQQILPVLIDGAVSLIQGLVAALPALLEVLINDVLPGLLSAILQIFTAIIEALPQLIEMICSALAGPLIPQLISGIISAVVILLSNFSKIIQPIIDYLPEIIVNIVDALLDNLPILIEGIVIFVVNLCKQLPQILMAVVRAVVGVITSIWDHIKEWFNAAGIPQWFGQIFGKAKDKVKGAWASVTGFFTNIKNKIVGAFANIKEKLLAPFERARDAIKNIADKIKGFFKGNISMPKIKMPHFSISPAGWKFKDLFDGEIPKLSIKWYAEAMNNPMLLNDPTIFGYNARTGNLLGGGEAGAEVVSGANTLMGMIGDAVENRTAGANEQIVNVLLAILDAIMTGNRDTLKALVAGQTLTWNNREVARMVREYA